MMTKRLTSRGSSGSRITASAMLVSGPGRDQDEPPGMRARRGDDRVDRVDGRAPAPPARAGSRSRGRSRPWTARASLGSARAERPRPARPGTSAAPGERQHRAGVAGGGGEAHVADHGRDADEAAAARRRRRAGRRRRRCRCRRRRTGGPASADMERSSSSTACPRSGARAGGRHCGRRRPRRVKAGATFAGDGCEPLRKNRGTMGPSGRTHDLRLGRRLRQRAAYRRRRQFPAAVGRARGGIRRRAALGAGAPRWISPTATAPRRAARPVPARRRRRRASSCSSTAATGCGSTSRSGRIWPKARCAAAGRSPCRATRSAPHARISRHHAADRRGDRLRGGPRRRADRARRPFGRRPSRRAHGAASTARSPTPTRAAVSPASRRSAACSTCAR